MCRGILPAVLLGFFLDLLLGDPRWLYHPVRMIGNGISWCEKILRRVFPATKRGERIAGVFLVVVILAFSAGIPFLILWAAYAVHPAVGFLLETFFCYQLLALRSLKDESGKVYEALKTGDLAKSRYAVSMIVGRDTQNLTEQGVTKAAVETVAENTSDGIVAPLFYMMIGGAVLGFAYKAVNTMDSMVGYKNERYQYFGTAAARADDLVNFLPARLAAVLMILSAFLLRMKGRQAADIYRRDRRNHKSPNAAQTESVMAGALGVQLAGDAWYFGTRYHKPTIGDPLRRIEPEDILRSHRLMYLTSLLALAAFWGIKAAVFVWL